MQAISTQRFVRLIIYVLALTLLGGSLLYSNYLANQLEEKERAGVKLYADALEFTGNLDLEDPQASLDALEFILNNLVINMDNNLPRLLIGEEGEIKSWVLEVDTTRMSDEQLNRFLRVKMNSFQDENPPIKVEYSEGRYEYVYFGESKLLRRLRWFPFLQLLMAFTFVSVVFIGFAVAKGNEQNRVWVGLAKETAHQLGTPVSSLMAWIELLKLRMEDRKEDMKLLVEMEQDVFRLENITERFSKIGSEPELQSVSFQEVLAHSTRYLETRMTRKGHIRIKVENELSHESTLMVNPQLFDWVIENLLKNALDAIKTQKGQITLHAGERGSQYYIDITDTGKGIPKSHYKKVFNPGFTTKKRGWGLGLSLSKRIIEQYHKGKIFVRYSELGKGTTFRILLPKPS